MRCSQLGCMLDVRFLEPNFGIHNEVNEKRELVIPKVHTRAVCEFLMSTMI